MPAWPRGDRSAPARSIGRRCMSGRRFTLDSNILVYAVDRSAGQRHLVAEALIMHAAERDCRLTLPAVSEFYAAVTRKRIVPARDAAMIAADWMELFPCAAASAEAVRLALDAAATGRAAYWDALLVACAAEAGCAAFLTEDLADGGILFGVRIVNPFAPGGVAAAEVLGGG